MPADLSASLPPWPPLDTGQPAAPLRDGWRLGVALPIMVYTPAATDGSEAIADLFDYALPDRSFNSVDPGDVRSGDAPDEQRFTAGQLIGCRVRVTVGKRELIGVVFTQRPLSQQGGLPADELNPVLEVLDCKPILPADLRRLLQWAAGYYHSPLGEVVATALPVLLRQGRALDLLARYWRITPQAATTLPGRSTRQQEALQALSLYEAHGASEATLLLMGHERTTLQALAGKGLAESFEQEKEPQPDQPRLSEVPLTPSSEQQAAIDAIRQLVQPAAYRFEGFLLEGLTGSGKTEVYLQVMQTVLEQRKQVLVLVPEIGLTPQTIQRFKRRFAAGIVQLHSGMTDLMRLQSWTAAMRGEASILIGTRSAIFTPLPRLGLIVVDEEHDLSYKQQDTFRYHARDVALMRGQMAQCPVILGSATPSLESLHLVNRGRLQHLHLSERAGSAALAELKLIDLRGKTRSAGLSPPLINAIRQTLDAGNQVLVFLNRRGYAPVLLCESCGWQADCPRCDAHLTVHQTPLHLHCHHCDYQSRLPAACPQCQSVNLAPTGTGTARVEELLQAQFASVPVIRVDRDSTSKRGSWEHIYEQAQQDQPVILLGTQMLAKGHHFPYVTLVAVLDVDGGFLSADFRGAERAAQLLVQVSGRSGRGARQGQVLIQTYQPDNPLLQTLLQQGYDRFARDTLQQRQLAALPPYRHAVLLRAEAMQPDMTQQFLAYAVGAFKAQAGSHHAEIWGPIPAPMEKRAGVYRGHVLILFQQRQLRQQLIAQWWRDLVKTPERRGVRISLDIDPMELD